MKIPEFKIRTDLALEEREGLKEAAEEVSGVSFKKWEGKRSAAQITEVKVLNEHGAKALGKPMGSYLTLEADKLLMPDEDFHSEVSDELALLLKGLLKQKTGKNILVAGLGNQSVTPDSLGPRTVSNLCVSAEGLKAIAPGVMAQTGMETARILLGIIKEVQPDLVIAIDTSGSCSGEIVRRFLEETWRILNTEGQFFRKMNIHVIQCDCVIQEHEQITCEEEWKEYLDKVTVKGGGDTDFTPVFRLVEELQKNGRLKNLKGLLYFTDGDGVYPTERPGYETAFVFLDEALKKGKPPVWAHSLTLDLCEETTT